MRIWENDEKKWGGPRKSNAYWVPSSFFFLVGLFSLFFLIYYTPLECPLKYGGGIWNDFIVYFLINLCLTVYFWKLFFGVIEQITLLSVMYGRKQDLPEGRAELAISVLWVSQSNKTVCPNGAASEELICRRPWNSPLGFICIYFRVSNPSPWTTSYSR